MLVLTDLDGTLLNSEHKISDRDIFSLKKTTEAGHICVIATGRSIFSARSVIAKDLPIRYLVFSSGAGIMRWPSEELIFSSKLSVTQVDLIKEKLDYYNLDYMIHHKVPDNHYFSWFRHSDCNQDFESRLNRYESFSEKGSGLYKLKDSSQLIAVLQPERVIPDIFLSDYFINNGIKVIRTTSPLDKKSIWLEFFNEDVSKGKAAYFIAKLHNIDREQTMAVGNDYNDTDMLNWCRYSFIVGNAPEDLLSKYLQVPDNNSSGFSVAIYKAGLRDIIR